MFPPLPVGARKHRPDDVPPVKKEESVDENYDEMYDESNPSSPLGTRQELEEWRQLSRDMGRLLEGAKESGDFTLVCQGKEVPCHRAILLARCPTLTQGVTATMTEGAEDRRQVRGVEVMDMSVLKDLLTFIYTGNLPKHKARMGELLEVAHMYQLAGLVDTCREAALQQITVDTSLHILATLHRFALGDGEDEQKEAAVRFVQRNLARVRGTSDWETFASSLPDLVEEVEGRRGRRVGF